MCSACHLFTRCAVDPERSTARRGCAHASRLRCVAAGLAGLLPALLAPARHGLASVLAKGWAGSRKDGCRISSSSINCARSSWLVCWYSTVALPVATCRCWAPCARTTCRCWAPCARKETRPGHGVALPAFWFPFPCLGQLG